MVPRKDLEGRLPIVYCGKPVEEWYSISCREILERQKLSRLAIAVLRKSHVGDQNFIDGLKGEEFSELRDALTNLSDHFKDEDLDDYEEEGFFERH